MLWISRMEIYISDGNNCGQGSSFAQAVTQYINALGPWTTYNWIATIGKRYHIAEGDGLSTPIPCSTISTRSNGTAQMSTSATPGEHLATTTDHPVTWHCSE